MAATLGNEGYCAGGVLYMAMELSDRTWVLMFGNGERRRLRRVDAGDCEGVLAELEKARGALRVDSDAALVSCYEAGRDGFWLHRWLEESGVENVVVDSSSILVERRARRSKTDRLDAQALLEQLIRHHRGGERVWSVVRVPDEGAEARRRPQRERSRLIKESTAHQNRIRSLLVGQGVRMKLERDFLECLAQVRDGQGRALSGELRRELEREWRRLELVREQIAAIEGERRERLAEGGADTALVRQLMSLKGVGPQSAWLLVSELFGWRRFANRRELAAAVGLAPTPYASGATVREQGISKAGNRRVRTALIELSWLWLRHQPESVHSQWFERRFGAGGARQRRIGIVALARRLVIELWRFVQTGLVGEGTRLKAA